MSHRHYKIAGNVFRLCVRAGLSKPRPVPDTERNKDNKTLNYTPTPLDANTVLWPRAQILLTSIYVQSYLQINTSKFPLI
jgi:hypothetical protein